MELDLCLMHKSVSHKIKNRCLNFEAGKLVVDEENNTEILR